MYIFWYDILIFDIFIPILCKKYKNFYAFFSFPKSGQRRQEWIDFVKTPGFIPKKTSVLCSSHFAQECFDYSSKLKVRLFPTAVPTIEINRVRYVSSFNGRRAC